MNQDSFPADGMEKNGTAPEASPVSVSAPGEAGFVERRQGYRRLLERRLEERRVINRREDAERRGDDRRFLTMEALEAADAEASEMRREDGAGLWPSLDWRAGNKRLTQRRASERRIDDRRSEDRRKTDRRSRGRRKTDSIEDLYHGQIQLDEDIDDLAEAGDYKGSAD